MDDFIVAGSSPRGMIMLVKAAKVNAWMNDRDHVQPIDVEYVFHAVMAHRLVLNRIYEISYFSRWLWNQIIRRDED